MNNTLVTIIITAIAIITPSMLLSQPNVGVSPLYDIGDFIDVSDIVLMVDEIL